MNEKILAQFNNIAIRSSDDLMRSIDYYIATLQVKGEQGAISKNRRIPVVRLIKSFKEQLNCLTLPFLDAPFQSYEVAITDAEIELCIAEYSNLSFDEDGELTESICSISPSLLHIRSPYVSVDEYAKRYRVQPSTVEKWIAQRKLKNLQTSDKGWLIAETQGRPRQGPVDGCYFMYKFKQTFGDILPEFSEANALQIIPIDKYGREYLVRSFADDGRYAGQSINSDELSRIEAALIGNPDIIFVGSDAETIFEKPRLSSDDLNGISGMESFLTEKANVSTADVDLPLDAKELLEIMSSITSKNEDLLTVSTLTFRECLEGYIEDAATIRRGSSFLNSLD